VSAQATFDDFRVELLYALIRCGDPDIETTVREVASNSDDGASRFAGFAPGRLDQLRPRRDRG
jgi:hypothetical protein